MTEVREHEERKISNVLYIELVVVTSSEADLYFQQRASL